VRSFRQEDFVVTEFLIIIAVIDVLVFVALYSVMKAGRTADRSSEAQARAMWATSERVRREIPLGGSRVTPGIAGRKVIDSHGSMLGVAGELLLDPLDASTRWLEVHVRGLGSARLAHVPADGLRLNMNIAQIAVSRDHVLRSPVVLPGPLSRESEFALCRHYGLSRRIGELQSRHPGETTATSQPAAVSVA
jgi:hypothetical protein